jgi:hypothetical protein
VKNAVAAARSSTTMPMCSKRWTVMNSGLLVSWGHAARGLHSDERSRSALLDIREVVPCWRSELDGIGR